MRNIILASQSPRRREILRRMGVEFVAKKSGFDERIITCEEPKELVEELALQKALAVARDEQDAIIVGGDTVVSVGGEILGKAKREEEAREILTKLIGTKHEVWTGVAAVDSLTGETRAGSERAEVSFRTVGEKELGEYLAAGYWRGLAGGYAIQGKAGKWVREWKGVFSAIIGMPVELTAQLLEEMGVIVEGEIKQLEEKIKREKIKY